MSDLEDRQRINRQIAEKLGYYVDTAPQETISTVYALYGPSDDEIVGGYAYSEAGAWEEGPDFCGDLRLAWELPDVFRVIDAHSRRQQLATLPPHIRASAILNVNKPSIANEISGMTATDAAYALATRWLAAQED